MTSKESAKGRDRDANDDVDSLKRQLDALDKQFRSYEGGDRPPSPPARLLYEDRILRARLREAVQKLAVEESD